MSVWKLQKLCYYAQAWALAWTEKELFSADFEAWTNRLVCPKLYEVHKGLYMADESCISEGEISHLTEDEKDTINIIIKDYGDKEPYVLREMTHSEVPMENS